MRDLAAVREVGVGVSLSAGFGPENVFLTGGGGEECGETTASALLGTASSACYPGFFSTFLCTAASYKKQEARAGV